MNFFYTLLLACSCSMLCGQNLVPNASFENHSACPSGHDEVYKILDWTLPPSHTGTTDYYHACGTNNYGVPTNIMGSQMARTGEAYVGLYIGFSTTAPSDYREYIQVRLTSPLQAGVTYSVAAYLSLPEYASYTVDKFGFTLTNTPLSGNQNFYVLAATPQVESTSTYFNNLTGWDLVTGSFVAAGGEEYLTIGNFQDGANTNMQTTGASPAYSSGYVYVDDVIVQRGEIVGMAEPQTARDLNFYPTQLMGGDLLRIEVDAQLQESVSIELYDGIGRNVARAEWSLEAGNQRLEYSLPFLSPGVYMARVSAGSRTRTHKLRIH